MPLPPDVILSKISEEDLIRYDLHKENKNIGAAHVRPFSTEGDGPFITGLRVAQEHRGKGLAKYLLRQIEEDYKNKTIRLRAKPYKDAPLSQDDLVRFYQSMGYQPYDEDYRMYKKAGYVGGYLGEFLKLAMKKAPNTTSPQFEKLVDSVVRMPGPTERPRKFHNMSPTPTEVSKNQAQRNLHASQEVGNDVKTRRTEGIG